MNQKQITEEFLQTANLHQHSTNLESWIYEGLNSLKVVKSGMTEWIRHRLDQPTKEQT